MSSFLPPDAPLSAADEKEVAFLHSVVGPPGSEREVVDDAAERLSGLLATRERAGVSWDSTLETLARDNLWQQIPDLGHSLEIVSPETWLHTHASLKGMTPSQVLAVLPAASPPSPPLGSFVASSADALDAPCIDRLLSRRASLMGVGMSKALAPSLRSSLLVSIVSHAPWPGDRKSWHDSYSSSRAPMETAVASDFRALAASGMLASEVLEAIAGMLTGSFRGRSRVVEEWVAALIQSGSSSDEMLVPVVAASFSKLSQHWRASACQDDRVSASVRTLLMQDMEPSKVALWKNPGDGVVAWLVANHTSVGPNRLIHMLPADCGPATVVAVEEHIGDLCALPEVRQGLSARASIRASPLIREALKSDIDAGTAYNLLSDLRPDEFLTLLDVVARTEHENAGRVLERAAQKGMHVPMDLFARIMSAGPSDPAAWAAHVARVLAAFSAQERPSRRI